VSPYTEEMLEELRNENRRIETQRRIFLILNFVAAIAMAILFALILSDRNSIKREANVRATQIQQQRYDVAYGNCLDQNGRNRNTIQTLNNLISKLPPSQLAQAEQSKEFTILLINALVPIRNCQQVAKQSVQPLPAPNHN